MFLCCFGQKVRGGNLKFQNSILFWDKENGVDHDQSASARSTLSINVSMFGVHTKTVKEHKMGLVTTKPVFGFPAK